MSGTLRTSRQSRWRRRGVSVVEMAILLPMILLILLGMIEYGWCFLKQEQILNTARQAARMGALVNATTAQVNNEITSMMTSYGMTNAQGNTVYTATLNPGTVETIPKGQTLTVTIKVTYSKVAINDSNSSLAPISLPMPNQITGTVTMVKEGQ
jgi:Flp pilus assembly protein TadG